MPSSPFGSVLPLVPIHRWTTQELTNMNNSRNHQAADQQPSCGEATSANNSYRAQRLESYVNEPIKDGNRFVMISAQSSSASGKHITSAARDKMATKVESVMRPFYNVNGHR